MKDSDKLRILSNFIQLYANAYDCIIAEIESVPDCEEKKLSTRNYKQFIEILNDLKSIIEQEG